MNTRLITRYAIRETMGVIIVAVALFWSAGRLDWTPAWVVVFITAAWTIATASVILRINPALLAERLGPRKGAKSWDTAIMSLLGLLQLARYILAGLGQRYDWNSGFPDIAQIIAILVTIAGYALFVWAIASNAYFSQIVRLQGERGHAVASGGPYQFVRHPAYIGSILVELALPILLSSWWAMLPSAINVVLLILRTFLEDRALQAELPGYAEYASQTRFRLLPGVW